jgi:hypothetical protein
MRVTTATRQPAKVALLHMDVPMLRAQEAQEQPFAGGNEATVRHFQMNQGAAGHFFQCTSRAGCLG